MEEESIQYFLEFYFLGVFIGSGNFFLGWFRICFIVSSELSGIIKMGHFSVLSLVLPIFIAVIIKNMQPESEGPKDLLNDREQLIRLIEGLLKDILQQTQSLPKGTSKFHCKDPPAISIGDYLRRISKYAHCSNSAYVVALIYIDRFQQRTQEFVINRFCMHRLLICSIMLAAKYLDDFYYKNDYYAKVGGISKADINILQIEFMMNLDFSMHVNAKEFETYLQKLYGFKEVNPKNEPIKTPSISQ